MVPTAERRATTVKADVDGRVPTKVRLSCAQEIIDYRPVDGRRGLTTPLLVIAVEDDATTPTDHAVALYQAARGPKQLCCSGTPPITPSYDRYWEATTPRIVGWFNRHLGPADIVVAQSHIRDSRTSHGGSA